MSALQDLLTKLSEKEQSKRATLPLHQNSSPNAFTTTEIEMAKTLCTLPSNGQEERMDNETNGKEANSEHNVHKNEEFDVNKFEEDGTGGDEICRPIDRSVSTHSSTSSEKIFLNANFESFAEFDCAFEEWKSLYKHPFRVASSEKHHDTKFKYRYVVYHCSRYGEPRKRGRAGQGRRPHQNYLPCGCHAKLRLNFHPHPGDGCLVVTTLLTEHNHEPMSECHSMWLKRRKSSPEEDATGAAERSGEGERDFESNGEHSPNSTASSSTALFSPLSLHAPQAHQQLLHNSPSSSGGQSSSESGGSSSASGAETAAVAALLMRAMPPSPLSEAIGGVQMQRQAMGRPRSAMFTDTGEPGNSLKMGQQQPLSASFKHPLLGTSPAAQFVHGTPNQQQQQQHSQLLTSLKAALMANGNGGSKDKDGTTTAQISGGGLGNACKKLVGEMFRQQQQQLRTSADQRQIDQQQQQQQWHLFPIIQELVRLEQQQQQHSLTNSSTNQTLFALISQSLQRDQNQQTNSASPLPAGTSATALLSAALRSMNVPAPPAPITAASSSVGFFPPINQSPSSSSSASSCSSSSLLHLPTVSPLISLLQQAHLINAIGQPYGANAFQRLSPPHAQQQQNIGATTNIGNGTTTSFIAQQMQMGGEKQRREQQQQMADNALTIGRAEIIKEADLLLQTLVNQMIHSKDLVSYLARLRQFLAGSTA